MVPSPYLPYNSEIASHLPIEGHEFRDFHRALRNSTNQEKTLFGTYDTLLATDPLPTTETPIVRNCTKGDQNAPMSPPLKIYRRIAFPKSELHLSAAV
jgi:hypothetical protein